MNMHIRRRDVLKGTGALVVSMALPGVVTQAATLASRLPLKPEQLATYISINQNGSAVAWIGKVDMGQGTDIGWAVMVAEELDLPADRVSIVQGHTDVTVNQGGASGSTGIWRGGTALRNAAAEARRILIEMAAEKLSLPADRITVVNGVVGDRNNANKKVAYGELIGGRHLDVTMEWNKKFGNRLLGNGKGQPKGPRQAKLVRKSGHGPRAR